jgi:hypothetical protein
VKLVDSDRGLLTPGWWYPYGDRAVEGLRGLLGALYADGVGSRALAAVAVAALTVYDMAKAVDKGMRIEGIELVSKTKEPV